MVLNVLYYFSDHRIARTIETRGSKGCIKYGIKCKPGVDKCCGREGLYCGQQYPGSDDSKLK